MRKTVILTAVAATLALAACSKPTQDKTSADLKAVGADMGAAAKDVAHGDALAAVGSDIKQGAAEAADKTKDAADRAGAELKSGMQKAGSDLKEGAKKADARIDEAVKK